MTERSLRISQKCIISSTTFKSYVLMEIQQLLYVAHNSFERSKKSPGYILLRILRSYVELDTFLAFDVQTEETISAGRQEMANFARLIEVSACNNLLVEFLIVYPALHKGRQGHNSREELEFH